MNAVAATLRLTLERTRTLSHAHICVHGAHRGKVSVRPLAHIVRTRTRNTYAQVQCAECKHVPNRRSDDGEVRADAAERKLKDANACVRLREYELWTRVCAGAVYGRA